MSRLRERPRFISDREGQRGISSFEEKRDMREAEHLQRQAVVAEGKRVIGVDQPQQGLIAEARQSPAQTAADAQKRSALSGAFGRGAQQKAQNLQDRQDLFKEMQGEGAAGRGDALRERARDLGISEDDYNRTADGVGLIGANPLITPSAREEARRPAPAAPAPAAPAPREPETALSQFRSTVEGVGKARAQKNIKELGLTGAIEDFRRRQKLQKV